MLTPEYKGYEGLFEYDEDTQSFFGNAIAIKDRSAITFNGGSAKEIIKNFQNAVDKHLESLNELENKIGATQLDAEVVTNSIENIKHKLIAVTQGPWRWSDWETSFGSKEASGLENKRVLEYSPNRGASRGSEIHNYDDDCIKILKVEEPLSNDQNAYFIADARQDVETLIAIAEFLLEENKKLKLSQVC
jgi:hypothetical protein